MTTQHRPARETHKQQETPLLQSFYASVKNGNVKRADTLLGELNKHPPQGLWMHRALGLAIEGHGKNRHSMVSMLLSSPRPPKPTEASDFIRPAMLHGDMELVYTLMEHGFRAHRRTIDAILQRIEWDPKLDMSRMKVSYLHGASKEMLVSNCARAIVRNASEHWVLTLNACLPQPLPGQAITAAILHEMARIGDRMDRVDMKSIHLARKLWWIDENMAKLEYDKILGQKHYTGKPLWGKEMLDHYGQAMSIIERAGIEEESIVHHPTAPASPRKRL